MPLYLNVISQAQRVGNVGQERVIPRQVILQGGRVIGRIGDLLEQGIW